MTECKKFNQIQYQNDYIRERYDRIIFLVPKGEKEALKETAQSLGMSMNEFIRSAVKDKMAQYEK